ncbi:MAG TPA: universal stress protein [Candidatus Limnocylindrales bacterium]|nr:universal stress protein [Candidatus Limnocylindrales bacterium]
MKRILVAYDGGEAGTRALDTAIELERGLGATVDVVSVVPVRPGRAPIDPWDDREAHARLLREAKDALQTAGIKAVYREPYGDPATTIERIADEIGADMVVVGTRGFGAVERFFQGSVSEHVALNAKTTVVVAR